MADKDLVTPSTNLIAIGGTEADYGNPNADVMWQKDPEDVGFATNVMDLGVDALIKKGAKLLQKFESRTGYFRQMAEIIVALRCKHHTRMTDAAGKPVRDLGGRSTEYRNAIRRMYIEAGIPRATESNMSRSILYHVRKLVWDISTPEEKKLLKLKDPYQMPTPAAAPEPRQSSNGDGDGQTATATADGESTTTGSQSGNGDGDAPAINREMDPFMVIADVVGRVRALNSLTLPTDETERGRFLVLVDECDELWQAFLRRVRDAGALDETEEEEGTEERQTA